MSRINPASVLASDGPLFAQHRAIAAHLALAFDPKFFVHAPFPVRPSRKLFERLVDRTPFVGLVWGAVQPDSASGRMLQGSAQWTVILVTRSADGTARVFGDRAQPGLYAMVQVAAAALHGWTIGGEGAAGSGTVAVTAAEALTAEDWTADDLAIAAVSIAIPFALTDTWQIEPLRRLGMAWQLDADTPALADASFSLEDA